MELFSCDEITNKSLEYLSHVSFTRISLCLCVCITHEGILHLSKSSYATLRSLSLCRMRITDERCISILQSTSQLIYLEIDNFPGITDDTLHAISCYCHSIRSIHGNIHTSSAITQQGIQFLIDRCKWIESLKVRSMSRDLELYLSCIKAYQTTLKCIYIPWHTYNKDLNGVNNLIKECRYNVEVMTDEDMSSDTSRSGRIPLHMP